MKKFLDDIPEIDLGRKGRTRPKNPRPEVEPENVLVRYTILKCPKCRSRRVPVYNSNKVPIRYHKCLNCGFLFKSIETDDRETKGPADSRDGYKS